MHKQQRGSSPQQCRSCRTRPSPGGKPADGPNSNSSSRDAHAQEPAAAAAYSSSRVGGLALHSPAGPPAAAATPSRHSGRTSSTPTADPLGHGVGIRRSMTASLVGRPSFTADDPTRALCAPEFPGLPAPAPPQEYTSPHSITDKIRTPRQDLSWRERLAPHWAAAPAQHGQQRKPRQLQVLGAQCSQRTAAQDQTGCVRQQFQHASAARQRHE